MSSEPVSVSITTQTTHNQEKSSSREHWKDKVDKGMKGTYEMTDE